MCVASEEQYPKVASGFHTHTHTHTQREEACSFHHLPGPTSQSCGLAGLFLALPACKVVSAPFPVPWRDVALHFQNNMCHLSEQPGPQKKCSQIEKYKQSGAGHGPDREARAIKMTSVSGTKKRSQPSLGQPLNSPVGRRDGGRLVAEESSSVPTSGGSQAPGTSAPRRSNS